ncbi:PAQR family membrane homeostasis protein TrhA [Longimicrobium sp.]|uniref:PAQR family membrane homeostasis protein TrhA n=1 Tax=Longimicrobium sp. TaxID=2029185 RepID=UPI003B3B1CD5
MMDQSDDSRWELANALTHGAGAVAALAGAAVLIVAASVYGGTMEIVSSAVFSATMVLLYTASTLYHAARRPEVKARLKVFDHCAIYLLIAGSYTPFTLIGLRGGWGWSLFGVAWGLAVAGVIFKLFFTGRFPRISTAIYVGMGWMAIVAINPMLERLSGTTVAWLVAGGLAYTAGTVFYLNRRPYAHAVWHLFVLAGSVCHYAAVMTQVLPPGPT